MKCNQCEKEINEEAICLNCVSVNRISNMWELEKFERIKKIIDEIIKLHELDRKSNPYEKDSYEHLFDDMGE